MTFDWTTFLLEILNFLVLLWILRRFLYRPVLEVIAARQRRIEDGLREAEATREAARGAQAECEARLAAFEAEKAAARAGLEREIAAERERLLAEVADEVAEARARRQAREARERQEGERLAEARAVQLGSRFVARLLERLAGPELEARLVALALADLAALPEAERARLHTALAGGRVEVATAFPLAAPQREALAANLAALAGQAVAADFAVDPGLGAGLCIEAGPWSLAANLRDELAFFSEPESHRGD
jgi:F-type H+-transporting ATPase subunit b